ncbi:MAG: type III toxin-antitoxin system ToxN/AbiQ family toxin, partial [Clostridia bacterium]|nr:type III toxin-antitoxin system ToxN/AbiQ family toxin [Clostridia bacterium]
YSISDNYIKYLRKFDDKIYDNKEEIRTHERKYLGIVLTVNEFNYYIPMSSPKKSDYLDFDKKIIRNDTKTIIRIHDNNRLYGTLRISNMIPVPITELEPYIISNEDDLKYREVILGELRYINNNSDRIVKYVKTVYNQKIRDIDVGYIKNTVDFKLLEEKLKEWNKENN